MKKYLRIIIIILPIIYGIYISYFKKEVKIIFPNNNITISGYIDDYKEERIASNRYRVRIEKFNNIEVTETARILMVTSPYTDYKYGEVIFITGSIENPKDFITDTGKTFDYDNYLKLSNVYGIMREPEIKTTGLNKGDFFIKNLYKVRELFAKSLNRKLNNDDAVLTRGVLLGEKTGIADNLRENLARTSTSHIIALSGYNITIASEIMMKLSSGFSIFMRSILGSFGILVFILLAGGGSSAWRAGIMAFVLLYARYRGKNYDALYALCVATSILVLINPLSLRYDMGFHLSILATFGLIVFQKDIAIYLIKKKINKFIAETLASTIAASIMTMPYIAYNMGIVSILGIFVNLIVVPLTPVLMLFGFLTGIMPNILALPFTLLTHLTSKIILTVINKTGGISFAAVYENNINLALILLIYLIIFYFAFIKLKKSS